MTEAEWLKSKDPAAMGAAVVRRKRASPRVLRLYMAAFWHWQARWLRTPDARELLRTRATLVGQWAETDTEPPEARAARMFVGFTVRAAEGFLSTVRAPAGWKPKNRGAALTRAVWLLREMFGNPLAPRRKKKGAPRRAWLFDPKWRTDTVLTLARQMYDADEFSAMPILADALQDAGCDNEDVLTHCRTEKEHARGCWVVDLVLGKR